MRLDGASPVQLTKMNSGWFALRRNQLIPRLTGFQASTQAWKARFFGTSIMSRPINHVIDADIKGKEDQRQEHIRRLSEVANILVDAGIILIITAIELTQEDLEIMKTIITAEKIETIWVGDNLTTDIAYDMKIHDQSSVDETADKLKSMLQEKGIIFKPW